MGCSRRGDVGDVGYSGCELFRMLDVGNVGCSRCGCSGCGMFWMWDVSGVGCSGCGIFRMCDVDLQNTLSLGFKMKLNHFFEMKAKRFFVLGRKPTQMFP